MRIGYIMQIVFFIGFLVTGTVMMIVCGGRTNTISESENRKLMQFPAYSLQSIISGFYFHELENYVADHIAFRDSLIHTSKYIASLHGWSGRDSVVIVPSNANNSADAHQLPPAYDADAVAQKPEPTSRGPVLEPTHQDAKPLPDEKGKVHGKVLILGERAMNLYTYDPVSGQAYADVINQIQENLEHTMPKQVRTSVLLAPTAVEFVQSAKLKSLSGSQRQAIDDVYSKMNSGINKVDALSLLQQHVEEPIFFRTDHHWTATGAYYAYAAYIHSLGLQPVPIASYSTDEVTGFLGSLYSSTLSRQLAEHPDTVLYYKPSVKHQYVVHYSGPLQLPLLDMNHAKKKNKYRIFLSGDRPWGQITTEVNNQRRVVVVKDSYGNAFVPFLLPHYSEIFVVDPRQFDESIVEFIYKHNIQELLYVNNAGVTMDGGFSEQLRKLSHTYEMRGSENRP
jgi:hypothetical protein